MIIGSIAILGTILYLRIEAFPGGGYTSGFLEEQLEKKAMESNELQKLLEQERRQANSLRNEVVQIRNSNETTQSHLNRIITENQQERGKRESLEADAEWLKQYQQLERRKAKAYHQNLPTTL